MAINLTAPHQEPDLKPRITVVGVGGGGHQVQRGATRGGGGARKRKRAGGLYAWTPI